MQWIRLDTTLPRNHKTLVLLAQPNGHRTLWLYVCGLCYAGEQATDGFIPREVLPTFQAKKADVNRLVNLELWHETAGGFNIHDWADYQLSNDETRLRSDRARAAANVRWAANGNAPRIANGKAHTYIQTDLQTSLIPPQPPAAR